MDKTKIEWCDSTWNPVTGCRHGCGYCYARRLAERFSERDKPKTFHGGNQCVRAGGVDLHELERPALLVGEKGRMAAYPFGFEPTFYGYRLDQPKKWKEPRNIFVCSMADLFGKWVPDEWIKAVFEAADAAPQHRYIFLTKNPHRYVELAERGMLPDRHWYGYTANRQADLWTFKHADECPAKNLFVSIEPMLEPMKPGFSTHRPADWVIVGAETGNGKGKVTPRREWVDEIAAECEYGGRPLFMKDSLVPIVGEENMRREFPWE